MHSTYNCLGLRNKSPSIKLDRYTKISLATYPREYSGMLANTTSIYEQIELLTGQLTLVVEGARYPRNMTPPVLCGQWTV